MRQLPLIRIPKCLIRAVEKREERIREKLLLRIQRTEIEARYTIRALQEQVKTLQKWKERHQALMGKYGTAIAYWREQHDKVLESISKEWSYVEEDPRRVLAQKLIEYASSDRRPLAFTDREMFEIEEAKRLLRRPRLVRVDGEPKRRV